MGNNMFQSTTTVNCFAANLKHLPPCSVWQYICMLQSYKISHPTLRKHYSLCARHLLGLGCRTYCLRFCLVGCICFLRSSPWRRRGAIYSKFCSHLKMKTSSIFLKKHWIILTCTLPKTPQHLPTDLKNPQWRWSHQKETRSNLLQQNYSTAMH